MSKTRDTGYLANVIQVHDTGVRIMSGSEMLMAISSSGEVTITGVISGSNALSSSFSLNSDLLSGTGSVGFTTTSSFTTMSSSLSSRTTQIESVYATTGSNSFRATQSITGSLTVTGQIIAQTINVQQVTSSIVYSSGSNIFGNITSNTQTFTGSLQVTGSSNYIIGNIGFGTTNVAECVQASGTISIIQKSSVSSGPLIQFSGNGRIRPADAGDRLTIEGNALYLNSVFNSTVRIADGGGLVTIGSGGMCSTGTICAPNLIASSSGTSTSLIQAGNGVSIVRSNSADSADLFLGRCDTTRFTNVLYADSTQWPCSFRWSVGMRTGGSNYTIFNEVYNAAAIFVCQNNNFVGIGTSTPAELFTIYRNANADNRLAIYQGTSGYASAINLIGNDDSGTAYNAILSRTGTCTAHWQIGGGGNSNTMIMYTSGCERMRITSVGSVGINTSYSNSVYKLVVKSTTDVNLAFGIQGGEASIESFNDAVNASKPLRIYGETLKFFAGAERLRIGSTGIIYPQCFINSTDIVSQSNTSTWPVMSFSGANGIGGINQGAGTYDWGLIKGDTSRGYYGRIIVGLHADNTIDQGFFGSGWTNQFVINQSNGNAYLRGTLTQGSDCRVKTNICNLTYGICEIMQLRPVSYNKIIFNRDTCGNLLSESIDTCNKYIGFVAQEVKPLIPEVVNGDENSENPEHGLSVEYQNMVALLVKGMQEQQCKIALLESCLGIA
jgi:hypothetical protein